jgi:hypothetical protein
MRHVLGKFPKAVRSEGAGGNLFAASRLQQWNLSVRTVGVHLLLFPLLNEKGRLTLRRDKYVIALHRHCLQLYIYWHTFPNCVNVPWGFHNSDKETFVFLSPHVRARVKRMLSRASWYLTLNHTKIASDHHVTSPDITELDMSGESRPRYVSFTSNQSAATDNADAQTEANISRNVYDSCSYLMAVADPPSAASSFLNQYETVESIQH